MKCNAEVANKSTENTKFLIKFYLNKHFAIFVLVLSFSP